MRLICLRIDLDFFSARWHRAGAFTGSACESDPLACPKKYWLCQKKLLQIEGLAAWEHKAVPDRTLLRAAQCRPRAKAPCEGQRREGLVPEGN